MENYIVRVLRRDPEQKGHTVHLDGIVEMVASGKRRPFHNADELWSILGEEIVAQDQQIASLEVVETETAGEHED